MTIHPTPELYMTFRQALPLLKKRIGATKADFVCWIFFDELKAYCHVHEFAKPPEFNLAGIALTNWQSSGNGSPPYLKALDDAFFLAADVDAFDPPNRYIAFADLVQRWLPHCETQELTANFIRSRIQQSRLSDFAPWLGETELSRVFFPSLPDDCERLRPPADWAMFNLVEIEAIEANDFPSSKPPQSKGENLSDASKDTEPAITGRMFSVEPSWLEEETGHRLRILKALENIIAEHPGENINAAMVHNHFKKNPKNGEKLPALHSLETRISELKKIGRFPITY